MPKVLDIVNGVSEFSMIVLLAIVVNSYCIMLQRYNCIRINQILKKGKDREKDKK